MIRKSPRIAFRTIDEETFIVTPWDQKLHGLNSTGTALWRWLDEGVDTVEALAARLTQAFLVETAAARADVRRWVDALVAAGALERHDG